jgi:hypothetical protein
MPLSLVKNQLVCASRNENIQFFFGKPTFGSPCTCIEWRHLSITFDDPSLLPEKILYPPEPVAIYPRPPEARIFLFTASLASDRLRGEQYPYHVYPEQTRKISPPPARRHVTPRVKPVGSHISGVGDHRWLLIEFFFQSIWGSMQFFTLIPNNTFILLCTVSWEWKALKTSDFYWKTIKIAKYDSNVSPIWTQIHPFVLIIFLVFFRGEKTAQHMWKSVWRHMKWQPVYCKKWNYFPVQNGESRTIFDL